jgi:hypothetical protein
MNRPSLLHQIDRPINPFRIVGEVQLTWGESESQKENQQKILNHPSMRHHAIPAMLPTQVASHTDDVLNFH